MTDRNRQSGRTTRQMVHANYGAIFIWCTYTTDYARLLARKLGREDLVIKGCDWIDPGRIDRLAGESRQIVIDHGLVIGPKERASLQRIGEAADVVLMGDLPAVCAGEGP